MPNCNCGYSTSKTFNFKRHLQRNPPHCEVSVAITVGEEASSVNSSTSSTLGLATPVNSVSKAPVPSSVANGGQNLSLLTAGVSQTLTPPTVQDSEKEDARIAHIRPNLPGFGSSSAHPDIQMTMRNAGIELHDGDTRLMILESHMTQVLRQLESLRSEVHDLSSFCSDICHVAKFHQRTH